MEVGEKEQVARRREVTRLRLTRVTWHFLRDVPMPNTNPSGRTGCRSASRACSRSLCLRWRRERGTESERERKKKKKREKRKADDIQDEARELSRGRAKYMREFPAVTALMKYMRRATVA